jgi:D-3-phosphoglycerate dehydrogenase
VSGIARVAVASRSFSRHPVLRAELLGRHPIVSFNDDGRTLSGADLAAFIRGHDALIVGLETVDGGLLDQVPELRVVSKYGVGVDSIDLAALERRGVRLGWTGGVNRRSVAELAVMFAVALFHRVPAATRQVQGGGWSPVRGRLLSDRTVGVLGCGHVGKDVVRLLEPFGCRVLAHDLLDFPEFYARHHVTPVDLAALLRGSDVVTIHLPLDASTRGMLDAARLATMKPGAVLVNTARGGIVEEAAVKAMLRDGRLAGAGFDVLAAEPAVDAELVALPNVMVTPHIGGSTEEAVLAMGRAAIDGLATADLPSRIPELRRLLG